jgi:hypothetical protein
MNIPADQRMALSGLELDAMWGRLRGGDGRDPGRLRGLGVPQRRPQGRGGAPGGHRRPASGPALHQGAAAFFAGHAPPGVGRDDLVPLGPVLVVLLKWVPKGLPNKTTIEQWHSRARSPQGRVQPEDGQPGLGPEFTAAKARALGLRPATNRGRAHDRHGRADRAPGVFIAEFQGDRIRAFRQ